MMMLLYRIFTMLILTMGFQRLPAQSRDHIKSPLTEKHVILFMKTELAVNQLQKQIIARKGNFDQLEREEIKAFYEKRKPLIESYGWDLETFEKVRERVFAARSGMESYEKYKKDEAEHQENIEQNAYRKQEEENQEVYREMRDEIEANDVLSEEQKKTMLDQIEEMQRRTRGMGEPLKQGEKEYLKQQQEGAVQNRADWPAVRPYLDKLQHLTDWYNGNRADPPIIE